MIFNTKLNNRCTDFTLNKYQNEVHHQPVSGVPFWANIEMLKFPAFPGGRQSVPCNGQGN